MSHIRTVKQFIVSEFLPDVRAEDLDERVDLVATGVVDSLGLLKLLVWLEDRFDILAEDVDLDPDRFRTVEAIDGFITAATSEPRALRTAEG